MDLTESLRRQKVLGKETYLYLKRDRKYLLNALGQWFFIFRLNLNLGDKYRSTYHLFRNIDDVLDEDRVVSEDPLVYAGSIKTALQKEIFDFNRYPILRAAQTSLKHLESVKKPGDNPKGLMLELIDAMISDHLRMKNKKVLSQDKLLEEYSKQFYPMHNLQLICVGSNVRFYEGVDDFPILQARIQSLSDLEKDWNKKLFNIPLKILQDAEIDPKTTIYEKLLQSSIIKRWIYSEAQDCTIKLQETKNILISKLQGEEEIYGRIIFKGLIFGLERSLKGILKESREK